MLPTFLLREKFQGCTAFPSLTAWRLPQTSYSFSLEQCTEMWDIGFNVLTSLLKRRFCFLPSLYSTELSAAVSQLSLFPRIGSCNARTLATHYLFPSILKAESHDCAPPSFPLCQAACWELPTPLPWRSILECCEAERKLFFFPKGEASGLFSWFAFWNTIVLWCLKDPGPIPFRNQTCYTVFFWLLIGHFHSLII